VPLSSHQVGKYPGWRLNVQFKLQLAPVLAPVMSQLIPWFAVTKLAQIDEIA